MNLDEGLSVLEFYVREEYVSISENTFKCKIINCNACKFYEKEKCTLVNFKLSFAYKYPELFL